MGDLDPTAIEQRVRLVSYLLAAHGGRIEVLSVTPEGTVRLRFGGFCTACPLKPVTLAAVVRPALADLDGVTAVEAVGARLSKEAEFQLTSLLERGNVSTLGVDSLPPD
jgi:Fe-S cluster biogenesis protein NfuA